MPSAESYGAPRLRRRLGIRQHDGYRVETAAPARPRLPSCQRHRAPRRESGSGCSAITLSVLRPMLPVEPRMAMPRGYSLRRPPRIRTIPGRTRAPRRSHCRCDPDQATVPRQQQHAAVLERLAERLNMLSVRSPTTEKMPTTQPKAMHGMAGKRKYAWRRTRATNDTAAQGFRRRRPPRFCRGSRAAPVVLPAQCSAPRRTRRCPPRSPTAAATGRFAARARLRMARGHLLRAGRGR